MGGSTDAPSVVWVYFSPVHSPSSTRRSNYLSIYLHRDSFGPPTKNLRTTFHTLPPRSRTVMRPRSHRSDHIVERPALRSRSRSCSRRILPPPDVRSALRDPSGAGEQEHRREDEEGSWCWSVVRGILRWEHSRTVPRESVSEACTSSVDADADVGEHKSSASEVPNYVDLDHRRDGAYNRAVTWNVGCARQGEQKKEQLARSRTRGRQLSSGRKAI